MSAALFILGGTTPGRLRSSRPTETTRRQAPLMTTYLLKRVLLILPTLFGIMLINFAVIQFAPGGPVERVIAQISGTDVSATARISGSQGDGLSAQRSQSGQGGGEVGSKYRGAQGLDPEFIRQLEKQFGFDKPAYERFLLMMRNYLLFDFGKS